MRRRNNTKQNSFTENQNKFIMIILFPTFYFEIPTQSIVKVFLVFSLIKDEYKIAPKIRIQHNQFIG